MAFLAMGNTTLYLTFFIIWILDEDDDEECEDENTEDINIDEDEEE